MSDLTLICANCHHEFIFSVEEQAFYQAKNVPQPTLCLICRAKARSHAQDLAKHGQSTDPRNH